MRLFRRSNNLTGEQGRVRGIDVETAINILILETDPGETLALVTELRRQDLPVSRLEIKPSAEAIPAISTHLPDVVLASFPQPECLLFELIDNLHESHRTLPVIAITARCAPGQLVELLECGAAAHLRRQNLGELASLIRFTIENPVSHPSPTELEIIREPDSSDSRSCSTRAKCNSPAAQHICERCSRIVDASGQWERFNVFLRRNQKVTVTLGLCPDCARTLDDDHALPVHVRL